MARVLYGIMGNTNGHLMRTRAIVAQLPEHEFHFVGGGRVAEEMRGRQPLLEVPVLRSVYLQGRLSISQTLWQTVCCEARIPAVFARLHRLVRDWRPDFFITDREFYLPLFCRWRGLPCLSIDHSHVMRAGQFEIPPALKKIWNLTLLNDRILFDFTKQNLIVSFFKPTRRPGNVDEIYSSVLRPEVARIKPSAGDAIFVYLTTPEFGPLLKLLEQQTRPVVVYGSKLAGSKQGHIHFESFHPEKLLHDLAGCAYAITNGGHNLICEALHYQKPILCFPIRNQAEQFVNADALRRLRYGDHVQDRIPTPSVLQDFERNLEDYRAQIQQGFQDETAALIARLRQLLSSPA